MYDGDNTALAILGTIAAAAVAAPVFNAWLRSQRSGGIRRAAETMGFAFSEAGLTGAELRDTGLQLFGTWNLRPPRNIAGFQAGGVQVQVFDFIIESRTRHDPAARRGTAALIPASSDVPAFSLRPRTLLGGLNAMVSGGTMELGAAPDFNAKFCLNSGDPEKTRAYLDRRADWLCAHSGFRVDGAPGWLLFWSDDFLSAETWPFLAEQARLYAEAGLHR